MKDSKPPKGWKPPGKPIPRHLRPTTWHSSSNPTPVPPPQYYTLDRYRHEARLMALLWEPDKGSITKR